MHRLLQLSGVIDQVNRYVGRATAWCIGASVLIATGNAVMRKAFRVGSNAWVEAEWYLFAAAFMLAAGYLLLVDEHVRVDAVAQRLPARVRAWLDLVALLVFTLPMCVLMTWLGAEYFWRAWASGERSYMADGLAIWPVRLFMPVGFALLGLQVLSEAVKRAHFLQEGRDRPGLTEADLPPFMGADPQPGSMLGSTRGSTRGSAS